MATDYMRAMLDELMGSGGGNDGDGGEVSNKFKGRDVCRSFLLKCCPHEILNATRGDLGECRLSHNIAYRSDYDRARQKDPTLFFEFDAYKSLKSFIDETDRKIEHSKLKLAEKQKDISEEIEDKANGVHEINEKIGKLLADAEKMGMEGEVEKSQEIMKEVEALKDEKRNAEQSYRNSMPSSLLQQQRLRVCEVCSSYLENFDGVHDNDKRLADHYGGKLHLGFIDLRDRLKELEKFCTEKKDEYDKKVAEDRQNGKHRSRSRSRDRSRDRSYRRRSRSRSRDRSRRDRRHRSRSRSRDRHRRHRRR